MKIFDKLFGTHSERELKLITPVIDRIEELRPAMQALSDGELRRRQMSTGRGFQKARRWMICFRRHLPRSEKRPGACSVWNITGYS